MAMHSVRLNKKYLVPVFALLVVAVAVATLELTNTTHLLHNDTSKPAATSNQQTKGEPAATAGDSNSSSSEGTSQKGQTSGGSANNNATLLTPSGTFVSNHHPNLSGSPAPNSMNSVCTTTPGASCKITFTKDGVTKSLTPQTTDSSGSTYWNWKLQDLGLSVGSWRVDAIATFGDKSTTATDSLNLEVQQ